MGAAKLRLAVAAVLFLSWIGWLLYLVVNTRNPVILSRPQLLVSQLWVLADVAEKSGRPDPEVSVRKVFWSAKGQTNEPPQTHIIVADLPDIGTRQGWSGPGEYIVPLDERPDGKSVIYQVTPLPLSPGFVPSFKTVRLISAGDKKGKLNEVTELVVKVTGMDFAQAKKRLARPPFDLKKNVDPQEAMELKKQFKHLGALVDFRDQESRIYRATAQALAQLEEIRAK